MERWLESILPKAFRALEIQLVLGPGRDLPEKEGIETWARGVQLASQQKHTALPGCFSDIHAGPQAFRLSKFFSQYAATKQEEKQERSIYIPEKNTREPILGKSSG